MDELACSTGSIKVATDVGPSCGLRRRCHLLPRYEGEGRSGDQEDLAHAELSPPPAGGGPAPPQPPFPRLESEGGATKEKAFVALQTLMLTKENGSSSDPTVGSQPFVRSVVQESPSPRPPPP
ncbi:unnamed protein product [Musa acuminata var. zebrina]